LNNLYGSGEITTERFSGIEGEAYFVGSIVHSLDHRNARDLIPDPLVFLGVRPEFVPMAETDMYCWSCFITDIPIVGGNFLFPRRYRDSPDPFHKAVYKECVRINKRDADDIDVCIIK
jgi:hypothetical protein